jgi:hypothetical protein
LFGAAMLPMQSIEAAVQELRFAAKELPPLLRPSLFWRGLIEQSFEALARNRLGHESIETCLFRIGVIFGLAVSESAIRRVAQSRLCSRSAGYRVAVHSPG